jgi:Zn-dependent peptidase ImmA (M78 family)
MIRSREARSRAQQLLEAVGVKEPPVDVNAIAEFLGFTVIAFDFPDSTAGLTFIEAGVKTIGVNCNHATVRQRFSAAHELGHYLSGHEAYDYGATYVEDRPSYLDPQHRQELEANEFAAELLMPERMLRIDVSRMGLDAAALAKRYQVSEQAMWIQLIDLELASQYATR